MGLEISPFIQLNKAHLISLIVLFYPLMASFSTKDFFGDPLWPAEFHMTKKRPQDKEIENDFSQKEQEQELIKIEEIEPEGAYELSPEDMLDLEKNLLLNQEKLDSMMKHSEITFMDENFSQNKDLASIFTPRKSAFINGKRKQIHDHEESIYFDEKLSILQPGLDECTSKKGKRKLRKSLKILKKRKKQRKERKQGKERKEKKEKRSIRRYQKSNLVICKFEDLENGMFTRSGKKIGGEKKEIRQTGKNQNQYKTEVKYSVKNEESSKEKTQEAKIVKLPQQIPQLQIQIMRKFELLPPPQIQHPEVNLQHQSQSQINSASKLNKYKILTKQEKQYLVYLASQTTICDVARRFNISVNNICRWKKGCDRKMGAGRKITSMELESKVIDYVKEAIESGKTLSRKQVQMKAREFSNNSEFKASKGWFQRFYNRNFKIFVKIEPKIQQLQGQNSE